MRHSQVLSLLLLLESWEYSQTRTKNKRTVKADLSHGNCSTASTSTLKIDERTSWLENPQTRTHNKIFYTNNENNCSSHASETKDEIQIRLNIERLNDGLEIRPSTMDFKAIQLNLLWWKEKERSVCDILVFEQWWILMHSQSSDMHLFDHIPVKLQCIVGCMWAPYNKQLSMTNNIANLSVRDRILALVQ